MYVAHIALQGCLRAAATDYGLTADTGGHIKYLLELAECQAKHPNIDRVDILTRGFSDVRLGPAYSIASEEMPWGGRIVRLLTGNDAYLPKELLFEDHDGLLSEACRWIESAPRRPDIFHAHYCDAGWLAAELKKRFGIPYLFTAHSLGRVKAAALDASSSLERRITFEDRVIREADGIIASSRDEAERQYPLYGAYDPGRIRVIAPGSDLSTFSSARSTLTIRRQLRRFLADIDKPALLAIARPVRKKNLIALVRAYGNSPELQQAANLIIVAGSRGRIDQLETESAEVMAELLAVIDDYDLYGKVAYPKRHDPQDVPAYYAYARESGGIFVNPAFNEPFGLTLLEAAAAGLPIIATNSGGPNDIIEVCRNGFLIDPHDQKALIDACRQLLGVPELWRKCSKNGERAASLYNWNVHCEEYEHFARRIALAAVQPQSSTPLALQTMLASDIDNTLLGSDDALTAFCSWYEKRSDLLFGIATGRSFHSALSILAKSGAPFPAFIISGVGSEIYYRRSDDATFKRDDGWALHLANGWHREEIAALLDEEGALTPQGCLEQSRFKLSYFFVGEDPHAAGRIRALLSRKGMAATVIRSHKRYLDILPARASKGAAIDWVARHYDISPGRIIAAGDSGNDVEMLRAVPMAIIVANCCDDLPGHPELRHAYRATRSHAFGIVEGVQHFLGSRSI